MDYQRLGIFPASFFVVKITKKSPRELVGATRARYKKYSNPTFLKENLDSKVLSYIRKKHLYENS